MTVTYTLTEAALQQGARLHYDHRAPILRWLRPLLGGALIALAGLYLFQAERTNQVVGALMIPLGLLLLFRKSLWVRRCARNTLQGQPGDGTLPCTLSTSEEGIEIDATRVKSSSTWDSFVDLNVTPTGVLLYPQKTLFIWIPGDAEVDGGSWSDFCDFLSRNVTKRI